MNVGDVLDVHPTQTTFRFILSDCNVQKLLESLSQLLDAWTNRCYKHANLPHTMEDSTNAIASGSQSAPPSTPQKKRPWSSIQGSPASSSRKKNRQDLSTDRQTRSGDKDDDDDEEGEEEEEEEEDVQGEFECVQFERLVSLRCSVFGVRNRLETNSITSNT